ncbi:L-seryl-tRNA(Sec) kinase isoform X2 [Rhea pennata]|uniref:L-seryl-tRNA(Sec) kinase isoform X2 n=1 Tax=Rhea pennata TaxID=8795 RepID=UPI002E265F51
MAQREAAGRRRVGLCVLCGLPAAGKSTLARALRHRLPRRQRWDCALLPYDDLIPPQAFGPAAAEAGPAAQAPLLSRWKLYRHELLQYLEHFLEALINGDRLPAPRSRTASTWKSFVACYSLSFCQLFLECPLECCLRRNRLRSHPLPEQTIYQMAGKIEMPDLENNAWEKNSLILKSSECALEDNLQIIHLLANALENPVKQNEENTEQKEVDRAICAASTVHQADQTFRRIISQTMKDAKDKNVHPSEMKSLAEELNKLKADFLEDMRQRSHLKNQICQQNSDPVTSATSSFQDEATNVVNKYILK